MAETVELLAARDAAIRAMLPLVPQLGWSFEALSAAACLEAQFMFPGGAADMVEAYIDLADREMVASASGYPTELRLSGRVRALILGRLVQAEPHREAVRRGFAILAMPANAGAAARSAARTVDRIWHAAGDRSADFTWYTKRGILAAMYGSTLLFWMRPGSTSSSVEKFLDRQLAAVAGFSKLTARLRRRRAGVRSKP